MLITSNILRNSVRWLNYALGWALVRVLVWVRPSEASVNLIDEHVRIKTELSSRGIEGAIYNIPLSLTLWGSQSDFVHRKVSQQLNM